jgi:hypothetical protein
MASTSADGRENCGKPERKPTERGDRQNLSRRAPGGYRAAVRLLIVEDEAGLVSALQVALRREGYAVDQARTVAEARDKLGLNPYDVVLLDITLPDPRPPIANYVPFVLAGSLLVISGQICVGLDGKLSDTHNGKLGAEISLEEGQAAPGTQQGVLQSVLCVVGIPDDAPDRADHCLFKRADQLVP